MLPSIEMIIKNVDEEILLVVIKTFEVQYCVRGFHLFQGSWQPKLGEILNASNEDEPSFLVHDRYATACEDKNCKPGGHIPKYVSKQMYFFIKCGERIEMKVVFKRLARRRVRNTMHIFCNV